ncbi:predicted protein [Postia placenta Mad-698-R]|nr:predicted protein [Postia placenta Mad-698-R]
MSSQESLDKAGYIDDEKRTHVHVAAVSDEVNTGARFVAGTFEKVDPKWALRFRKKINWHIMPLICHEILYWIQYLDKTTLESSKSSLAPPRAVLMTGTAQIIIGFISFGVQLWQWLVIITGLFTLITVVAFWFTYPNSTTTTWFLVPEERVTAVQCIKAYNSIPQQCMLTDKRVHTPCVDMHAHDVALSRWDQRDVVAPLAPLFLSSIFYSLKLSNQAGVENKRFKKEQYILDFALRSISSNPWCRIRFYEALLDPKTWHFALFSALDNVPNSLTDQQQIIVAPVGFTSLQTTLLAYVGVIYFISTLLGILLVNLLPSTDKMGLLIGQWLTTISVTAFVVQLSWITNVTAGHTKKVTVNAIMLIAYCVGNAAGSSMWQAKYVPRIPKRASVGLSCG